MRPGGQPLAPCFLRIELGNDRVYERTVTRAELEAIMAPWVERTIEACAEAMRLAERAPGVEKIELDAVILVGGSTRVPAVLKRVEEFFGRTPHTELNPDEVVALGAEYILDAFMAQAGEIAFGVRICTNTSGVVVTNGQVEGIVVGD